MAILNSKMIGEVRDAAEREAQQLWYDDSARGELRAKYGALTGFTAVHTSVKLREAQATLDGRANAKPANSAPTPTPATDAELDRQRRARQTQNEKNLNPQFDDDQIEEGRQAQQRALDEAVKRGMLAGNSTWRRGQT